jgi:hypothetical protein
MAELFRYQRTEAGIELTLEEEARAQAAGVDIFELQKEIAKEKARECDERSSAHDPDCSLEASDYGEENSFLCPRIIQRGDVHHSLCADRTIPTACAEMLLQKLRPYLDTDTPVEFTHEL